MTALPVLLFQLGEAPLPVQTAHGAYVGWFERAWGGPLAVHDGRGGGRGPDPRSYAGIIVTGSVSSLVEPEPWMDDAAAFVRRAHEAGTPTLGVCFGHQLLGYAFGGRVVTNPNGWEIGSCDFELVDGAHRDPLFAGMARTLRVNFSHRDMVDPASLQGTGVRVLGANAACPTQVLAVDDHVRGVQFHPEMTGPITRAYIEARRALLADLDPDGLIDRTDDAPDGVAVMRNFRRHFVEGTPRP